MSDDVLVAITVMDWISNELIAMTVLVLACGAYMLAARGGT